MGYTTGFEKINRMSWACSANAERVRIQKKTDEHFTMTAQLEYDLARDELISLIAAQARTVPLGQRSDAAEALQQFLYKQYIESYNGSCDLLNPVRARAYAAATLLDCFLDDGQASLAFVLRLEKLDTQAKEGISIAA